MAMVMYLCCSYAILDVVFKKFNLSVETFCQINSLMCEFYDTSLVVFIIKFHM